MHSLSMAAHDVSNEERPEQEQGETHENVPAILTRIDAAHNRMVELEA